MNILFFPTFSSLNCRKLMDLYAEGNRENAEEMYPGLPISEGVACVERDFLDFLQNDFYRKPENTYWVAEENGVWISALRLNKISDGFWYLEALETHPAYRRKGYAKTLLSGVLDRLKANGPFVVRDCVYKGNEASIRTHLACGFCIASEAGTDYLRGGFADWEYGMLYSCP